MFGSAQYGPAISKTDPVPTEGSHSDAPNPADVTKATSVQRLRHKNMYFGAIGFIYDVKTGPFWEHSPTLYDISGVRGGWGKINKVILSSHTTLTLLTLHLSISCLILHCVADVSTQGMLKMYNAEVLSKFPVVQHFRFGSLFSWDRDPKAIPPPPSAHTSSQPVHKLSTTAPAPSASTPYAVSSSAKSNPPREQLPGIVSTPAPWASKPTNNTTPVDARRNPVPNRERKPRETVEDAKTSHGMPPPPTKAPWARKPD